MSTCTHLQDLAFRRTLLFSQCKTTKKLNDDEQCEVAVGDDEQCEVAVDDDEQCTVAGGG